MAPAYLSLWTQCLQELQLLPALNDDPDEQFRIVQRIAITVIQWHALPVPSMSTWERLVLEVKVGTTTMVPTMVALGHKLIQVDTWGPSVCNCPFSGLPLPLAAADLLYCECEAPIPFCCINCRRPHIYIKQHNNNLNVTPGAQILAKLCCLLLQAHLATFGAGQDASHV